MKNNGDRRLIRIAHVAEQWTFVGIWVIWAAMYSVGSAKDEPLSAIHLLESQQESTVSAQVAGSDSMKHLLQGVDRSAMNLVEGGSFDMGGEVDKPVHKVILPDFYLDKYEVTVAEYRKFCAATRHSMPSEPSWGWKENNPIVGVTWKDAADFASWSGKRLPTEAEWEYAARGGKESKGYRYSGSDDIGEVAWCYANSGKTTHPVGTKAPNELGLFDMSGNVAEWCADYYGGSYYARSAKLNPTGPKSGSDRVVRGGSYLGDEFDCQVSFRKSALPDRSSPKTGFRCAWSK